MLHPSPAMYAAFVGDVAMWTGLVTGSLMLASPILFDRFGWRGVAGVTPRFMALTGVPFFVGCVIFNFFPGAMAVLGPVMLKGLVYAGALLQVRL